MLEGKLGGCAWTVAIPVKGLIIFGYDVCHDAQDKTKSVGQYRMALKFLVQKILIG